MIKISGKVDKSNIYNGFNVLYNHIQLHNTYTDICGT